MAEGYDGERMELKLGGERYLYLGPIVVQRVDNKYLYSG